MSTKFGVGLAAAMFAVAAISSVAEAQPGGQRGPGRGGFGGGFGGGGFGGGGFGGGSKLFMVSGEQVQTELKISADQKAKIEEISKALREETRKLTPEGDLSREERQKKFEETREQRAKLTTEAEGKLDAVLNAEQQKRLDEISTQMAGIQGLRGEKLSAKLGLTADQKTKITGILDDQQKKSREMFRPAEGGGRPDFSGMREKMTALQKETTDSVNNVLTSEQKTKWEEAKGKAFEFRFGGRGQGGEGGRGRGGRGGEGGAGNRPAPEKKPEAKESDL